MRFNLIDMQGNILDTITAPAPDSIELEQAISEISVFHGVDVDEIEAERVKPAYKITRKREHEVCSSITVSNQLGETIVAFRYYHRPEDRKMMEGSDLMTFRVFSNSMTFDTVNVSRKDISRLVRRFRNA